MPIPVRTEQPERKSATDQVYEVLSTWIIDGTMRPGETLNEAELADYFHVSRTPVREAILRLSQKGFVDVYPSRSTRVSQINARSIEDVFEAVGEVAASIGELACRKQKAGDIEALQAINEEFRQAIRQKHYEQMTPLDVRFHARLAEMADNRWLTSVFNDLSSHAHRYANLQFNKGENQMTSADEHQEIIEALKQKDIEKVRQASKANWYGYYQERLKDFIEKNYPEQPE